MRLRYTYLHPGMIFGSFLVDNDTCQGVMSEMPIKGSHAIVAEDYLKTLNCIALH